MVSLIRDQHISRRSAGRRAVGYGEPPVRTTAFPIERYTGDEPERSHLRLSDQQINKRRRNIIPFPAAEHREQGERGQAHRGHAQRRAVRPTAGLSAGGAYQAEPGPLSSLLDGAVRLLYRPQDIGFVLASCLFLVSATLLLNAGSPLEELAFPNETPHVAQPEASAVSTVLYEHLDPAGEYDVIGESISTAPDQFSRMEVTEYTLKPGDTLLGLAVRFDLNMGTIISFNQIEDVRRMQAGDTYRIPDRDGILYTVRRGDSLSEIASEHNVDVDSILDANNLRSSTIQVGQSLFVPNARMDRVEVDLILGRLFAYPAQGDFTSGFGMRNDPFTGVRRFHNGIDFANGPGTPVTAAMAGRVAHVGNQLGNYGRFVIMKHARGFQTLYAHLDRVDVRTGTYLSQGERIGTMGNTGRSTGNHLHFSIIKDGSFVDPLDYLH